MLVKVDTLVHSWQVIDCCCQNFNSQTEKTWVPDVIWATPWKVYGEIATRSRIGAYLRLNEEVIFSILRLPTNLSHLDAQQLHDSLTHLHKECHEVSNQSAGRFCMRKTSMNCRDIRWQHYSTIISAQSFPCWIWGESPLVVEVYGFDFTSLPEIVRLRQHLKQVQLWNRSGPAVEYTLRKWVVNGHGGFLQWGIPLNHWFPHGKVPTHSLGWSWGPSFKNLKSELDTSTSWQMQHAMPVPHSFLSLSQHH